MVTEVIRAPCDASRAHCAPGGPGAPSPGRARWIIATTVIASSMAFVDGTVVNVALPAVQHRFAASAAEMQWVVEAYALVLAGCVLMGGALGDRLGRRRMFSLGTALFAVSSLACGLAPGVGWLVSARAVEGFGAALLVPGSLAILGASFEGPARARAVGTWSAFTAIASAGGPVLGGWLVQHVSWRWVFFINLPFAVAVLAMTYRHVPESRAPGRAPLDWRGAATATVGLAGLVAGALSMPQLGLTHPLVLLSLALGVVSLALFARVEAVGDAPMMPLPLFRARAFSGANLLTLLLYGALGGALYFVPFDLIQVQGYSATAAGAALLPLTVLLFLLSQRAERLMDRVGARALLTGGPAVAALGLALFAWPAIGGSYWATFFPAAVVLGVGMGLTVAPLTTTVMNAVGPEDVGIASGVNNAVARTASVMTLALMAVAAAGVFDGALGRRLAPLDLPAPAARALESERTSLAGAEVPSGLAPSQVEHVRTAIDDSFVRSFRVVMLLAAALAFASALVGWRALGPAGAPPTLRARAP